MVNPYQGFACSFNILFMKPLVTGRLILLLFYLFYMLPCKTVAQSISGVINAYYKITAVNTLTSTLTLTTTAGLTPGTRVLLIQMQGAAIDNTNTAAFGNITAINTTGNYEFNYVCGIAGNDVLLQYQLTRTYTPTGNVQLVTVPQYDDVTVTDTVKAADWNAATGTGGVLAMEADTVYLNAPVSASGLGFNGGGLNSFANGCVWSTNVTQYSMTVPPPGANISGAAKGQGIAAYITGADYGRGKQANGGGGGNNHNSGGGGGGHYGAGGIGGQRSNETTFQCHGANPGVGGLSVASLGYTTGNNRIFMGGGGGAGHENNSVGTPGGKGGGIVILTANVIVSAGAGILANGAVPVNNMLTDPFTAQGDGGGGGGAGGAIILNVNEVNGSVNVSATGAKGSECGVGLGVADCPGPGGGGGGGVVWMKGAAPIANVTSTTTGGANGVVGMASTVAACRGQAAGASAGSNGAAITGYVLPVSTPFICTPLRLKELRQRARPAQSTSALLDWHNLYPNPATENIGLTLLAKKPLTITVSIFNATGQQINVQSYKLPKGHATLQLPVTSLTPGIYWLVVECDKKRLLKSFLKQ
jgi:hypothetical protein